MLRLYFREQEKMYAYFVPMKMPPAVCQLTKLAMGNGGQMCHLIYTTIMWHMYQSNNLY